MTKLVKYKLLHHLNYLKTIGYEYHEVLDLVSTDIKNLRLPDDLNSLKEKVEHCYLCELSKCRKNVLFAYGNPNAKIMVIADEPSVSEDELGIHYSGKSGELLAKMIENVLQIKKEEVYFTTLVKCKSSNNLNNTHFESCNDYLFKQIDIIKPKLIVSLGEKVYSYLMNDYKNFLQMRGQEINFYNTKLIATYSSNFLLRNPSSKKDAYYDMLKIKNIMESQN